MTMGSTTKVDQDKPKQFPSYLPNKENNGLYSQHKNGFNITAWSIDHPHAIYAIYIAIVILAIIVLKSGLMPQRLMPYVESPTIGVIMNAPGMSASEIEQTISTPIEHRLSNIQDVRYIRSSSQDGLSIVVLQCPYGTDMTKAAGNVQSAVNSLRLNLPSTVNHLDPPRVTSMDMLNLPVLTVAVEGEQDNGWTPGLLRKFVEDEVAAALHGIPQVQSVRVYGGRISNSQVSSGYHFVDAGRNNTENRVKQGFRSRIIGLHEEAVELSITANPDAGAAPIIQNVWKRLLKLEKQHPGIKFEPAYDSERFVDNLFSHTCIELLQAVVLCGLIVFVFLRDWRGAAISLVTIPVSLAMALLFMVPFGFSLNSSTLIGLLLAIGRLVDDSVIDIHAIQRLYSSGMERRTAVIEGIRQVRRVVASSTFILVIALLPLIFCGGITQIMFVGLAYPIIFGLIASFIVSLTLTAVLADRWVRQPLAEQAKTESWLERLDAAYERLVLRLLNRRFAVVTTVVSVIIVGYGFYRLIGSEMMPLADIGQAYATLEMPAGSSYAQTREAVTGLEHILLRHPEVKKVSTEIGVEPDNINVTGYSMNRLNTASMMITFTDKSERQKNIWELIDQVRDELADMRQRVHCLQIKEMGSDVMASSDAPVQILVTGRDPRILSALAEQVADIAKGTPGAVQVSTSWVYKNQPYLIEHDGLKRSISVLAYYRKNGPPSMDLTMAIIRKASSDLNFPPGYGLEMRGDMTEMMDSFARLLKGLGIALLLITLVLIAQFGDCISPLQMVLSIPLELAGVFAGLYIAHQTFSSVSILAVIILTGMDFTTAILLIDQILRRRQQVTILRNNAISSACRERLRPILMTSLITIITMIPIAFFPSGGLDAYQPLGTVIVFGLISGTLLSLFVIPVMHSLVDDFTSWLKRNCMVNKSNQLPML